ncbi:MAG: hypothetical protein JO092_01585, partial [Candidatus Eremiobacteraeota bacterium]|nr:hypothetical protein [Candidatus Eremiobacteraeota bacterium]
MMLFYEISLLKAWYPFDSVLVAANYSFAQVWWVRFLIVEGVWNVAFIACFMTARLVAAQLGYAFFATVIAVQGLSLAILASSPIPLDADQYAYVYYGSLTERGVNPYVRYSQPIRLTPNEARIAIKWKNPPTPDAYGPGWTLANAAWLFPFRHASVETQVIVLRILASLATLACSLLLWLALGANPLRPYIFIAFALNPLVLNSEGTGAHNDIFLLLFGLAAYVLVQRRYFELSGAALALSISTKFAYIPLILPLLAAVQVLSGRWQRTLLTAIVLAAVLAVTALPFGFQHSFIDPVFLRGVQIGKLPAYSYLLWRAVQLAGLRPTPAPFAMLAPIIGIALGAAIALLALRGRREPLLELALFVAIFIVPSKHFGWYGVILAPMLLIPIP